MNFLNHHRRFSGQIQIHLNQYNALLWIFTADGVGFSTLDLLADLIVRIFHKIGIAPLSAFNQSIEITEIHSTQMSHFITLMNDQAFEKPF